METRSGDEEVVEVEVVTKLKFPPRSELLMSVTDMRSPGGSKLAGDVAETVSLRRPS